MSKEIYLGESNIAKEVKKLYIGQDDLARKVKKGYLGVDGLARQFYGLFTWKRYSVITSYNQTTSYIQSLQSNVQYYQGSALLLTTNNYICYGNSFALSTDIPNQTLSASSQGVKFNRNGTTLDTGAFWVRDYAKYGWCFYRAGTMSTISWSGSIELILSADLQEDVFYPEIRYIRGQYYDRGDNTAYMECREYRVQSQATQSKGTFIDLIMSENETDYPKNGYKNGYWYELVE